MNSTNGFPAELSDDEAYRFLDRALANMVERTDIPLGPGERGRLYGWYWGYYGRAAMDLYRATGESRFARLVERTTEALLEERDDQLGMLDDERELSFPGWGTRFKTGERANEITTAGLITIPMLEYAKATGEQWAADAAIETLLAFKPERVVVAGNRCYFMHQTQGIVEALNHAALYGAAIVHASQQDSSQWLAETAEMIYNYQISFVDHRCGAISWPYAPTPDQDKTALPSEALWKASATIELPVALSESGHADANAFLEDVAEALSTHPVLLRGKYPQFIGHDRKTAVDPERVSGGLTSFVSAFLQINNDSLREAIFQLMRTHPDLFPNGWKGGSRAMIMAWAHLRLARPS